MFIRMLLEYPHQHSGKMQENGKPATAGSTGWFTFLYIANLVHKILTILRKTMRLITQQKNKINQRVLKHVANQGFQ